MRFLTVLLCLSASATSVAKEPEKFLLWPEGAPDAKGDTEADKPALFLHRPEDGKANGACVIICPGGGYRALMMSYEGNDVARWFTKFGVTTAVLRSRIAPRYKHPAPMQDVHRAIRCARTNASAWGIDPKRIGVMGFSAGGHLAATAGVHHLAGDPLADDPVGQQATRPDFLVLAYPVISMQDGVTHAGSRANLLGRNPDPKLVEKMSLERQVSIHTPPTFLFHTDDDKVVKSENSVLFYNGLRKSKVPAEMHIYKSGPHGVGLDRHAATKSWGSLLRTWMDTMGFLKAKAQASDASR